MNREPDAHFHFRKAAMIVAIIVLLIGSVVEVYALTWLASEISIVNTLSLIMFTLLLGVINGRSYGQEVFGKMHWHLKSGTLPSDEAVNGAVMNIGSKLLLTPGVVTDILGLLIVIPKTRFIAKNIAINLFKKKLSRGEQWFFFQD